MRFLRIYQIQAMHSHWVAPLEDQERITLLHNSRPVQAAGDVLAEFDLLNCLHFIEVVDEEHSLPSVAFMAVKEAQVASQVDCKLHAFEAAVEHEFTHCSEHQCLT